MASGSPQWEQRRFRTIALFDMAFPPQLPFFISTLLFLLFLRTQNFRPPFCYDVSIVLFHLRPILALKRPPEAPRLLSFRPNIHAADLTNRACNYCRLHAVLGAPI